jgi:hypothetical protein
MPNVIDYVKGELVTPEGKKVKKITEGAGAVVPSGPIATGGGNFYAPGFGSNQVLDYEYYADDPPPAQEQPQAPQAPVVQEPNQNQGNSVDAKNDDKSGAGAIPDFESWAEAVMAGTGVLGFGGPITAAVGQGLGTVDYGADYNNANMIDRPGWDQALEEAKNSLPPGTPQQQIIARATTIFGNAHPGWSEGGQGGGSDPNSPANNISSPGEAKAAAGTPGMGGVAGDVISAEDMSAITSPNVTTASGPKPSGQSQGNSGKGLSSNTTSNKSYTGGGKFGKSSSQSFGGGKDNKGDGGGGGGGGPNKPDTAGATRGGGAANPGNTHFAKGGYVSEADYGVPTSMRQNYNRPTQAQAPAQQRPNGDGGYNAGGAVLNRGGPGHTTGNPNVVKPTKAGPGHTTGGNKPIPARTQRFVQSRATGGFVAGQGFAEGGVVPNQGFQDGGAVADDRFNPAPAAIADDGVVDNQPINADEGEYVIQRESADILGPEILNALNDPMKAKAFSDLFDAALGLDSGSSTEGVSPAPMLPPKKPAAPAPMGASLANDNGPAAPMAFNKGGYIGKRY